MTTAHKPSRDIADPQEILLGFLDYYRSAVERKVGELSEQDLRTSRLPSGWTPLELVKHLVYMERRWFRWGFLAEQIDDPFGDEDDQERWRVGEHETVEELIAALHAGGVRTREIVAAASLDDVAATGGRFTADDKRPQPTLAWTLAYVLQEYARHLGHLDVARELVDGSTGE